MVGQWTCDAYGAVVTAEHPHALSPPHLGHKGLFLDRLDVGVVGSGGVETPRLVPFAQAVYQVRNRAYSPALGRFFQRDPNESALTLIASSTYHGPGATVHQRANAAEPGRVHTPKPETPSRPRPGYTGPVTVPTPNLARLAGRFIVLEGPDGSGKSTQWRRLLALCAEQAVPVCEVRDPGSTPIGERIRAILLDRASEDMSITCEMLLYMAARAQLVHQHIRPALARGKLVLADRFIPSTFAYQGAAGGVPDAHIREVGLVATGGIEPDLVVVFDVDEDAASARLSPLLDRVEARGREFHRRVRDGYLTQANADPDRYAIIDARGTQEQVWGELLELLATRP